MSLNKMDTFLENVLSYIKFPFVKAEIRSELEDHILDKIHYYIEEGGYSGEEAEELSIKDMGDPKEVGTLLNKQHNPFWGGWILRISNGIIIFFIVIDIFFVGGLVLHSIFSGNMVKDIPKEDIVYRIDIKEKVKIDDRVIRFTNVVYDKSGNMNIFYEYYDLRSLGSGWSLGYIGDIMDNLGNTYLNGSGSSYGE